jgi:hypothetical protein
MRQCGIVHAPRQTRLALKRARRFRQPGPTARLTANQSGSYSTWPARLHDRVHTACIAEGAYTYEMNDKKKGFCCQ